MLKQEIQRSWLLAWPVMLATVMTPILSLVDASLMGHLAEPQFLAALGLAGLVLGYLQLSLNFLTFSMAGQAARSSSTLQLLPSLIAHGRLALILGLAVIGLAFSALSSLLALLNPNQSLVALTLSYLQVRLLSSPIMLLNLCLLGFFIGLGQTKVTLMAALAGQITNLGLSLLLVLHFELGVYGIALGSIAHDLLIFTLLIQALLRHGRAQQLPRLCWADLWPRQQGMRLKGSATLWLRSLCLVSVIASLQYWMGQQGAIELAANTLVLAVFMLVSSLLDGFAQAGQHRAGQASAQNNRHLLRLSLQATGLLSLMLIGLALALLWFGQELWVRLFTQQDAIQLQILALWPLLIGCLLVSAPAFWLDGIHNGLGHRKTMLASVFVPGLLFFSLWPLIDHSTILWLNLTLFMLFRACWLIAGLRITSFRDKPL